MQKKSILIVEDEILAAVTLEKVLNYWGYKMCRIVASGEEALEQVRYEQPDMAFIDIVLTGDMDGLELAQKIREFSQTPIIFMTGYDKEIVEEQIATGQALACLTKPMDLDRLKTIMKSVFS